MEYVDCQGMEGQGADLLCAGSEKLGRKTQVLAKVEGQA